MVGYPFSTAKRSTVGEPLEVPKVGVIDDGSILCTVQGGKYLYTEQHYDNFILSLEYKTESKVNSGIFVRWADLEDAVQSGT